MNHKHRHMDVLIVSLALFAMFFGAGSLLFPPYLGMEAGTQWPVGFLFFFVSDVGLAFVTIAAMVNKNGAMEQITGTIGRIPALVLNTVVIVCIGPLLAIPRTAATTFEMSVSPVFPDAPSNVFSIIFFVITFILTIKPNRVIDILGKFLTPLMVVALAVLILVGVLQPLGAVAQPMIDNVVAEGIINGYQAMDVLGALGFSIIICSTVTKRGYIQDGERIRVTFQACILAGMLLLVVHGGLTYLGATYSTIQDISQVNQASLIINIIQHLLGRPGVIMLGLIVGLACLTTAIGLIASSASYFEELTHGRVKYGVVVGIISAFSAVVSSWGLSTIISIASPILCVVYPVVVCLIVLSFFQKKIRCGGISRGAATAAFLVSLLTVAASYGMPCAWINQLPLSGYQLNWILPAVLGGVLGRIVSQWMQGQGEADV